MVEPRRKDLWGQKFNLLQILRGGYYDPGSIIILSYTEVQNAIKVMVDPIHLNLFQTTYIIVVLHFMSTKLSSCHHLPLFLVSHKTLSV